jgi:hypothetical protein
LELIATAGVGYSSSYSFESFIQLTFGSFFFLFYSSSLPLFVPSFGYYSFIQLVLSTNLIIISATQQAFHHLPRSIRKLTAEIIRDDIIRSFHQSSDKPLDQLLLAPKP